MEPTKVGIREFRSGLAEYIAADKPVAVTRHGQTVGFFIPTPVQMEANLKALRKAGEEFDRLLREHNVDVDEVVAEFDALQKATRTAARNRK